MCVRRAPRVDLMPKRKASMRTASASNAHRGKQLLDGRAEEQAPHDDDDDGVRLELNESVAMDGDAAPRVRRPRVGRLHAVLTSRPLALPPSMLRTLPPFSVASLTLSLKHSQADRNGVRHGRLKPLCKRL